MRRATALIGGPAEARATRGGSGRPAHAAASGGGPDARAARERLEARLAAALEALAAKSKRQQKGRPNRARKKSEPPKEPRASTTDPEARVL